MTQEVSVLFERHAPIDRAIVNAMIESTPENWSQIVLSIWRDSLQAGVGSFLHELSSPEGHAPVGPADSLYEATYNLDSLYVEVGMPRLSKAVYTAKTDGDGWSYQVQFAYFD